MNHNEYDALEDRRDEERRFEREDDARLDMMQTIVKRGFEAASKLKVIEVSFSEDEQIFVTVDVRDGTCPHYTMQIGSDDDQFVFLNDEEDGDEPIVRFDIPADWDEALDENNGS